MEITRSTNVTELKDLLERANLREYLNDFMEQGISLLYLILESQSYAKVFKRMIR